MDFKAIENSIKISESRTISSASEEVYLTQSALNQQLIRLEEELGVTLFSRSKSGISITEPGRVYLEYARKLISLRDEMLSILSDYAEYKTGTIRIGMPVIRGLEMFINIFPEFHERYPGIKLEPIEQTYSKRIQALNDGKVNIAFFTLPNTSNPDFDYYPLMKEELQLVVPKVDPRIEELRKQKEVDIASFSGEKFVVMEKGTTLRLMIDAIFKHARIKPHIIMETSSYKSVVSIVSYGSAYAISPNVVDSQESNSVEYFPIKGRPYRTFYAVMKKGNYISKPLKDFLDMSIAYWKNKNEY